ncbi:uncharacterized protein LOC111037410 [Myzus persicae]|uniref:uncharacterized protein LOC111037410 n=1 Tax=Myzus persicae TaxID=13164 RepID=UPI000B930B74|nr:uncharacterized protein LOC111037410 [Myzus persicae]XP_022175659.1 uncharacterized protein LOC111037410 [Myzus persicae]XP_022175660.1 uncharacterized protein LOC111037410 [Myzus persicae]XP_022175661.1 uncharacterized protein LOC111037410 [Myzus persicae]XP_022175662.1 uncharacterized protein LOC111037410 [Myzus persicae]XP_022175663.1 uncharacterized protein LOC111037410 [Myzus persicae]XP_022175664.1 uncharacterized protein LOC111037410 [Myzus persicae]XP_022175665.1 uncharacterized p
MHRWMGLTMSKMCGELECPEYYLCEIHDFQCYPCHSYCNKTSQNFDANRCEQQCQDYIHDYIKHYVKADEIQDTIQGEETLRSMMISILVLHIVVLLVIITILIALKWHRKRLMKNTDIRGKVSYSRNKMAVLKLEDNAVSTVSETVDQPATIIELETASSSNKLPCEDITLETQNFNGYDNLGMWKV